MGTLSSGQAEGLANPPRASRWSRPVPYAGHCIHTAAGAFTVATRFG